MEWTTERFYVFFVSYLQYIRNADMDVLKNTEVRDGKADAKETNERIGSIPESDEAFKVKDLLLGVSVEYAPKEGYNGMCYGQHTVVKSRL